MRVCHVCSGHSEDDGRVFHRECVTLAEAGYEVHLIARSARHEAHSNRAVSIHPLPDPKSRQERLARRWSVARMAASLCPDLYHVHEPELIGPVLAVAGPHPVIWDVHESYLDVLRTVTGSPNGPDPWSGPLGTSGSASLCVAAPGLLSRPI